MMNAQTQRSREGAEKFIGSFFLFALLFLCFSAPLHYTFGQPATTQSTPETAKLLDQVKSAYAQLTALDLTGKITGEFDVDGQKRTETLEFTTHFSAPNLFRLEAKDDAIIGSTGVHMYVYSQARNVFLEVDAPHEKVKLSDLPEPFPDLIGSQDPSLAFALAADPIADLREANTKIEKAADVKLDGSAFPAVKFVDKTSKEITTLVIDPKSHLIRRAIRDVSDAMAARGASEIKQATITIDYPSIKTNPTTQPAQFAWSPPSGARDANDVSAGDGEDASHLVGKPAPVFTLKDLDDKDVALKDLKGSVVVLDFWATWCGPCVMSLPKLDKLNADFKEQGVKFFAVNQGEDKDLVGGFMKSKNLTIPVLLDGDSSVGHKYDANAIPETVIIDKQGTIAKVFIGAGPDTETKIREAIEAALK